jgi:HAD superfamily phosphoserine phosphatase-like hydrolase
MKLSTCFAFDLDGTVTNQEILPLIAGTLGLEKEMSLLTDLTINGIIPFEDSFRLRCACLRSVPLDKIRAIVASVELNPDIENFIKNNRDNCAIVTGNLDIWIEPLVEKLGCKFFSSTGRQLLLVGSLLRKNHSVLELRKQYDRIVAIGDGVNDMPMFDEADVRIAYGGVHAAAKPLVKIADYITFSGSALCRLLNTL